jgi:serine/threonine protein phosphatase PrpC
VKKETGMLDWIRRLFGGGDTAKRERATTAPLSEGDIESLLQAQEVPYELQQLIAAAGQSVGKQREHNEDSLIAITTTLAGNAGTVPFGFYMVADGMGGHQFGEVASNAAIRVVAGQILRKFHTYLFAIPTQQPDDSLQEIMENAVKDAHRTVQRDAPGSGTTVTAALVVGQQVTIGHVGDSRAYAVHPAGRVEQLTHDHSLVQRLEELGHLNKEEAATFPHKNVLIRALGQGDSLEVDVFTLPFPHNSTLMLCTDGLWGVIQESDIQQILQQAPNLQRACHSLVQAANAAGGPDNISVVLAQMIG